MPQLQFGTRELGTNRPTFIIAEVGQNHQGDINVAKQLIEIAQVKSQSKMCNDKFLPNF